MDNANLFLNLYTKFGFTNPPFKTKLHTMKKLYTFLSFLLLSGLLFAGDVDVNRALTVAKNFYSQSTGALPQQVNLNLSYTCTNMQSASRSADAQPVYYVFNADNSAGFVVVSGDDLVSPVLAYSDNGTLDMSNLPQAVRKWMDGYKQQILYVKENVTTTTEEVNELWHDYFVNTVPTSVAARASRAVNPLCQTKWNQAPNENQLCPFDNGYNQRVVTGCVATAMAQIMKFWNFPTQGTGFHSYNDRNYGTLSANFGSTTYNWTQMPNVLNSANSSVGTLMLHCGIGVDMNYGVAATGGSSAYVITAGSPIQACAEYAYKTYFGYDPATMEGLKRQNFNDATWISKLKTDLDAGRPIQYAGFGNGGGHTWVCDGYDQNNFFHMNWGWGGNSDGYFSVNNLDPTSLGAGGGTGGFNSGQQALFGIKPLNGGGGGGGGGGNINQTGIKLYSAITVNANPIQAGSSLTVNTQIVNTGSTNFTGNYAAALFTSDGVFVDFIQEYTNQTMQAGYYYNVPFSMSSLNVVPGVYQIGIFFKNGSNNYSLVDPATFYNPVTITVTGPTNNIQMYSGSTVNPTTIVKGQSFTISNQIANYGASTFSGWLSADLFTLDGDFVTTIKELSGISMQAGFYYDIQFSSTGLNVEPGSYYVAFFSSPNNTNWTLVYGNSFPNPIKVTIVDAGLSPDMYENNNTSAAAYALNANFSGNNASVVTTGSNTHVGTDYDYYKVNLPSGTNYSINARVHDSYNSGNGQNYTNDVQFSYSVNGGALSSAFDDVMSGPIYVQNGGTVVFYVSDYFSGSTGTYLLDLQIARGQNVGIDEVSNSTLNVFPNPVSNTLFADVSEISGEYTFNLYNNMGQLAKTQTGFSSGENTARVDVTDLTAGVYIGQLVYGKGTMTTKVLIQK
jgi:hypothetical protein